MHGLRKRRDAEIIRAATFRTGAVGRQVGLEAVSLEPLRAMTCSRVPHPVGKGTLTSRMGESGLP